MPQATPNQTHIYRTQSKSNAPRSIQLDVCSATDLSYSAMQNGTLVERSSRVDLAAVASMQSTVVRYLSLHLREWLSINIHYPKANPHCMTYMNCDAVPDRLQLSPSHPPSFSSRALLFPHPAIFRIGKHVSPKHFPEPLRYTLRPPLGRRPLPPQPDSSPPAHRLRHSQLGARRSRHIPTLRPSLPLRLSLSVPDAKRPCKPLHPPTLRP